MSVVFISYRHDDSRADTGRLADRLEQRLGHEHVFRDIEAIRGGEDFMEAIARAIQGADAFVAVIGRHWAAITDERGRRRLDLLDDPVRQEIAMALRLGKRIVPVLVDGARMPIQEELPELLRPLAQREAVELSDARWNYDFDRLFDVLTAGGPAEEREPVAAPLTGVTHPRGYVASAMIAFFLWVGAFGLGFPALMSLVTDDSFGDIFAMALPYALVSGAFFGLALGWFIRGRTVELKFARREEFVARVQEAMAELGFLPAEGRAGVLTFRPSLRAGLGFGRITLVVRDTSATVIGANWVVRRLARRLA